VQAEKFKSPEPPPVGNIRRLFEMSPDEKKGLQRRIEQFGGMVQIFIHPEFEEYAQYARVHKEEEFARQGFWANSVFKNILSSDSDRVPPIFIFEHAQAVKKFEEKEKRLADMAVQPVYIIRTEYADPTPLSPNIENKYTWNVSSINDADRIRAWDFLISELQNLGVKKILIGGAELYVSKENDRGHTGCLGIAMRKLENFDLKLSTITWPEGKNEIRARAEKDSDPQASN
jgi:hypothetical protein